MSGPVHQQSEPTTPGDPGQHSPGMTDSRVHVLESLADGPATGPELAENLDCSRTAIWKHIQALRDQGFDIEAGSTGYELVDVPEYGGPAVEFGLDAPYRVEYRETVSSTNDLAREFAERGETDVVVLADEQTGGRGRRDRAWTSPAGGIWTSIVTCPDLPTARVPLFTLGAAVAAVEAVDSVGIEAAIKWPNDVLVEREGKEPGKLAGILTEMAGESSQVSWVVVGIGINANVDAAALAPGATSIRSLVGDVNRRDLVQDLLESFHDLASNPEAILPRWLEHATTLGREVRVDTGSGSVTGRAVEVTDVGALVVETGSERTTVHAGDCEHLRPVQD